MLIKWYGPSPAPQSHFYFEVCYWSYACFTLERSWVCEQPWVNFLSIFLTMIIPVCLHIYLLLWPLSQTIVVRQWLYFWWTDLLKPGQVIQRASHLIENPLWSRTCNNKHLQGYVFVIWRNMASSSQDTYMDAYLFAIACKYDKFRLLDLNASDVEKLLLQSIRDDADEADLKEYLTSTLLKITDEANEENGKFTMTV